MTKKIQMGVAFTLSLFFIIACGDSDPVKEYAKLEADSVPLSARKLRDKQALPRVDDFSISMEDNIKFVEGREKVIAVYAHTKIPNISYDLTLIKDAMAPGMELIGDQSESNKWNLVWTPPKGTLKKDGDDEFDITIDFKNIQGNDVQTNKTLSLLKAEATKVTRRIEVKMGNSLVNLEIDKKEFTLDSSQTVSFTVTATDPSSLSVDDIDIRIHDVPFGKKTIKAASFITAKSTPTYSKNSLSQTYVFSIPKGLSFSGKKSFKANFIAEGRNGSVSADLDVKFTVTSKVEK